MRLIKKIAPSILEKKLANNCAKDGIISNYDRILRQKCFFFQFLKFLSIFDEKIKFLTIMKKN